MTLDNFLSPDDQSRVVAAIEKAESLTSGEIRVHVEPNCVWGDAYERAVAVFNDLHMYDTRRRNAVLIYIAFNSHHLAIIGDSGINAVVPDGFWNDELAMLTGYLSEYRYADGICRTIGAIGEKLAKFFPPDEINDDEQPNEISFYNDEK